MGLSVVTGPVGPVIPLADVKAHCRVSGALDDTYLTSLIAAAAAHVEAYCELAIFQQTLLATFPCFETLLILPKPTVRSVTSLSYVDTNGVTQPFTDFEFINDVYSPYLIANTSWPEVLANKVKAVSVQYEAGFSELPEDIKIAMLLLVGHWYENREAVITGTITATMPIGVEAIVSHHKYFQ